jgi:hypothetical protein
MTSKFALLLLLASANASDDPCTEQVGSGGAGTRECVQKLSDAAPIPGTCGDLRAAYKSYSCCGNPSMQTQHQLVPMNPHKSITPNPCEGAKPTDAAFDNKPCFLEDVINAMEQSGTNVTKGYQGELASSSTTGPILTDYFTAGLCPVNVHWHLGTEHYSMGEYDEHGNGPNSHVYHIAEGHDRRLSGEVHEARLGFRCHHYNTADPKFTTPYKWHHCADMIVGETYEIHWPHSTLGACNTPNQYQSPFYDGVFCHLVSKLSGSLEGVDVAKNVGVQAQVFTLVNDESLYFPDLFRGMIVDGAYGADVAKYTGSTTGTSRSNTVCSAYAPITWQVDRACHLISASSFDKMCADMKSQKDDMTSDIFPHGSRILVEHSLAANNQN